MSLGKPQTLHISHKGAYSPTGISKTQKLPHEGAFTSPTIDMRLGKVDTTITDIDDVNKRQTVILGETG